MPNNRTRCDDFDIESGNRYGSRHRRHSRSRNRSRSRSQSRPHKHVLHESGRSRSRSVEHRRKNYERRGRETYSSSRSRSCSRGRSHRDRRHKHGNHRSRDRSESFDRSCSQSYSIASNKCGRNDNKRERRSCSRNSSQYDDEEHQNHHKYSILQNKNEAQIRSDHNKSLDNGAYTKNDLNELPLPDRYNDNSSSNSDYSYRHSNARSYYNFQSDEPIDKERIHREIEEKLRETLAREGKVYPPPKPEASHPVFANDGSFLEIFKKMQEQQKQQQQQAATSSTVVATAPAAAASIPVIPVASTTTVPYVAASAMGKSAPPPPLVGRRRGGKILKTGVVAKPKIQNETNSDPQDFWSLYLAEVNKYKNTACESEAGNRPLVK